MAVALSLLAVVATVLVVPRPAAAQPESLRPHVPMVGGMAFADPSVLIEGGTAYAYSTNSTFPSLNLQVSSSPDLYAWTHPVEAMPTTPEWAWPMGVGGEFWAPTVARFGEQYVIYFAGHHRDAPVLEPGWCIGHAVATSPEGPFEPAEEPLFCGVDGEEPISPLGPFEPADPLAVVLAALDPTLPTPMGPPQPVEDAGVIDPQVFIAPDGQHYLHFKAIDNRYQIWGVLLGPDGTTVESPAFGMVELPDTTPSWERASTPNGLATVLENPTMHHHGGGDEPYELLYSGSDWRTSDYATGRARCQGPLGPCTRVTTDQGWMVSRGGVGGPGGASIFTGPDGQPWLAYHAWVRGEPISNGRRMHVEPLGFEGGAPVLLQRPPTGDFQLQVGPGQVIFTGTANDPDTGERLRVVLEEESLALGEVQADAAGAFSATFPANQGTRTYCAEILPADGNVGRDLYCQQVEVPPPPIVATAPAPPPGATP